MFLLVHHGCSSLKVVASWPVIFYRAVAKTSLKAGPGPPCPKLPALFQTSGEPTTQKQFIQKVLEVWIMDTKKGRTVFHNKTGVTTYCWWLKSCTTKDDDYPIIYGVLTIPGGAGFQPSTVSQANATYRERCNLRWPSIECNLVSDPRGVPTRSEQSPNGWNDILWLWWMQVCCWGLGSIDFLLLKDLRCHHKITTQVWKMAIPSLCRTPLLHYKRYINLIVSIYDFSNHVLSIWTGLVPSVVVKLHGGLTLELAFWASRICSGLCSQNQKKSPFLVFPGGKFPYWLPSKDHVWSCTTGQRKHKLINWDTSSVSKISGSIRINIPQVLLGNPLGVQITNRNPWLWEWLRESKLQTLERGGSMRISFA